MKSVLWGLLAVILLLGFYFTLLTLISGKEFAILQFSNFWFFIIALAIGFGIQIGLYTYLRKAGGVVAVSGTTSTLAMVSCCSHYLVNILPIIGITAVVGFISQYQIQLFWFGLIANLAGIVYVGSRVVKFQKEHE